MATGIILAGGESRRMPGDKAFIVVAGRRVIDTQIEAMAPLFEDILIVANSERVKQLSIYEREGVRVVPETHRGKGPLGGLLSGLELSGSEENFVLACDMPFVRREAIQFILENLRGHQVAVPMTPAGLEPLHAAYHPDCIEVMSRQLSGGNLKVTDFFEHLDVNYIPLEEMQRFDPTLRLLLNINSPRDMREASGLYREIESEQPIGPTGGLSMPAEAESQEQESRGQDTGSG